MAKSDVLYIPSKYQAFGVIFSDADGTNLKTLYTVPADDANLIQLNISSTDSNAQDLLLYITINNINYLIGHVDIPAGSGTNGMTKVVNGLGSASALSTLVDDTTINRYLPLKGGTVLKAGMQATISSGMLVTVYGVVGDYSL